MDFSGYAHRGNLALIESMYQRWQESPSNVDESWRRFFEGYDLGYQHWEAELPEGEVASIVPDAPSMARPGTSDEAAWPLKLADLIHAYRSHGHLHANINPLDEYSQVNHEHSLDIEQFGFRAQDVENFCHATGIGSLPSAALKDVIALLKNVYCQNVGIEYTHIQDREQRQWLSDRLETATPLGTVSDDEKVRIFTHLYRAELFEKFVHKSFLGQKRFSLEGSEVMITALDTLRESSGQLGIHDVVIGMPHRGRLNLIVNILDRSFEEMFSEFEDPDLGEMVEGSGDVKYHLGTSCDYKTSDGHTLHMSLSSNPSHLEAVNPVALGRARAKQRSYDGNRSAVLPLLIHGDAAFAGQGLVMESIQLSQLNGYGTGGALHLIVNNQIGFTTTPDDGRSTRYPTDIAKMFECPVFHVNGNDPEAVRGSVRLALEFRQKFGKDVFIDLVCYRKFGHNEADDPSFTQPQMYQLIHQAKNAREHYQDRLLSEKVIDQAQAKSISSSYEASLQEALQKVRSRKDDMPRYQISSFDGVWQGMNDTYSHDTVNTAVPQDLLDKIVESMLRWPDSFQPHRKIIKQIERNKEVYFGHSGNGARPEPRGRVDWALAEALAFGSLLSEGTPIRLSGQDCRRGTFSQRHSVLIDANNGAPYTPLNTLGDDQAAYCVHNSPLSEAGVLGFDYGYSLDTPNMLIMWEAQFGDFVNGAQVIIDQFISSAEVKWKRSSGIVLLLPHGQEGMGPEHSSAREERFLQMCSEDNMQVVQPTTPAQYFHLLRRQVLRDFRKPLIVMTPKSLLRHKLCISPVSQLSSGFFHEVIDDDSVNAKSVTSVILCHGKVYYDLIESKPAAADNVAIVRIEQLYPWPVEQVKAMLKRYPNVHQLVWVQEEPQNMGGWFFVETRLQAIFGDSGPVIYIGRQPSASPAVGSHSLFRKQQQQLVDNAFSQCSQSKKKEDSK